MEKRKHLQAPRSWTGLAKEDARLTKAMKTIGIASAALLGLSHVLLDMPIGYFDAIVAVPTTLLVSHLYNKRNFVRAQDEYTVIKGQLDHRPTMIPNAGDSAENLQTLLARQAELARLYPVQK